jgi:hypothetical protein
LSVVGSALLLAIGSRAVAPDVASGQERACAIRRKSRVFVGLPDEAALDEYESAARSAQAIMRRVEHGLCVGEVRATRPPIPSRLRKALELGWAIELEEVRFDDRALGHARVLLRSSGAHPAELVIRVYLHHDVEWQIDSVRDESVRSSQTDPR